MDNNLNNILNSIKQLSAGDKIKILYLLQEEQKKKPTQQEIITFVSERTKELKRWNKDIDEWLEESRKFFNELGIVRD